MTDGDDGMPEAGTAGDPAALTRQTAPSPLPGAPGVWRGRGPEERAAALETADTVDVPKPWRRPRPVASTRSWPAPCHLDRHAPTHRPRRSYPRRPRARCRTADHRQAVHRRPLSARPPADPTPTTPSTRPRPMNVTVHAGAGATPGSWPRRRERGGSAADCPELDRPGRRAWRGTAPRHRSHRGVRPRLGNRCTSSTPAPTYGAPRSVPILTSQPEHDPCACHHDASTPPPQFDDPDGSGRGGRAVQ